MKKNNSNKSEDGKEDLTEITKSLKVIDTLLCSCFEPRGIGTELVFVFDVLQSKTKELKKQKKTHERVNAEEYIAVPSGETF